MPPVVFQVTVIYSTAMPILLWVACAGFTLKYWTEKWAVLRVHRRPRLASPCIFDDLISIGHVLLLVQMGFGFWVITSAGGTDPKGYVGNILCLGMRCGSIRAQAWPLVIVLDGKYSRGGWICASLKYA